MNSPHSSSWTGSSWRSIPMFLRFRQGFQEPDKPRSAIASASSRRQSLHSKQLFEMRAHRQVETYTRRQRLLEPPLVDCNDLPAARKLVKCALDHFGEFGIAFAEHQGIVRVGQEIAHDAEI